MVTIDSKITVPVFDVDNTSGSIAWMAYSENHMLYVLRDGVDACECYTVSEEDIDAIGELYEIMVTDFVNFNFEEWYCGTASDWSLFDDAASRSDAGLLNLLDLFGGRTYGEFLNDVMHKVILGCELKEAGTDMVEEEDASSAALRAEDRLNKKVIDKCSVGGFYVCGETEDEPDHFWRVALANGKVWFRRKCINVGEVPDESLELGAISICDADGLEALRDMAFGDFYSGDCEIGLDERNALGLLGIFPEDE